MTDIILIYTLCASAVEADIIATTLLDEKLIACANIGSPVISHYEWQGKRERSEETPVFLKTVRHKYKAVERRLQGLHSYDCPCVLSIPVAGIADDYAEWLRQAVKA